MKKFMNDNAKRRVRNYFAPFWLGGFKASMVRGWRGGWPPEMLFVAVVVCSFFMPLPKGDEAENTGMFILSLIPFNLLWGTLAVFLYRSANNNKHALWRTIFKVYGATMLFMALLVLFMVGAMGITMII